MSINLNLSNTEIITPVGRLVMGDCFKPQTKDAEGRPILDKQGNPSQLFFVAVAVPKMVNGAINKEVLELKNKINHIAKEAFPTFFNKNGECIKEGFAFKIKDGDSEVPNEKMVKPCDKEGFKGCWVFNFSTKFPVRCAEKGGSPAILDPERIKRGHWIRVFGSAVGNGSLQKPGVYLNLSMIEHVGFGEEIISRPTLTPALFAASPIGAMPEGVSDVPLLKLTAGHSITMASPPSEISSFLNPEPRERKYLDAQGLEFTHAQFIEAGYTEEQISKLEIKK